MDGQSPVGRRGSGVDHVHDVVDVCGQRIERDAEVQFGMTLHSVGYISEIERGQNRYVAGYAAACWSVVDASVTTAPVHSWARTGRRIWGQATTFWLAVESHGFGIIRNRKGNHATHTHRRRTHGRGPPRANGHG
ncbi:MAG TPA: hypothetical protein VGD39_09455, partial [Nocardioides sp.]